VYTADFHYDLPPELVAQEPAGRRDASRLLVLRRADGAVAHRNFPDLLEYLRPGDALVLNDSRVIPARLRGRKPETGGEVEVLLAEEQGTNDWWVMLKPGKRVRPGTRIQFHCSDGSPASLAATVCEKSQEGLYRLAFSGAEDIRNALGGVGEVPLPPYIARPAGPLAGDGERYQTVFARPAGSVAAPTAGLHFTRELLDQARAMGIQVGWVTLHVGLGTFAPVKVERLAEHRMHEEAFVLPAETAELITATRRRGGRVVAVGTTSVRVLESVAAVHAGQLVPGAGRTGIFIYPPYSFRVVDALLTNFHLPESTLLMLVSAFATPGELHGREMVLGAYAIAAAERYRFFSYGDAMLIL
jgi:S-adenosylmethionine:tRNA ribosyltransferase-isomerase